MKYDEIVEYIEDNFPELEWHKDIDLEMHVYSLEDEAGDTLFSITVPFKRYFQDDKFIDHHIIVKEIGDKSGYDDVKKFMHACKNIHIENYNEVLKVKHYVEDGNMQDDVNTLFRLGFEGLDDCDQSGDRKAAEHNSSLHYELSNIKFTVLLPYVTDHYFLDEYDLDISKGAVHYKYEFKTLDELLNYIVNGGE